MSTCMTPWRRMEERRGLTTEWKPNRLLASIVGSVAVSGCRWSKRAVVSSGFVATRLSCPFEGVGIANLSMKTIVPVISTTMRAIKARCTIVGSVGGFLEKTTSSDAVRGRETSRCIRGNRSRSWGASGPNSGQEKSVPMLGFRRLSFDCTQLDRPDIGQLEGVNEAKIVLGIIACIKDQCQLWNLSRGAKSVRQECLKVLDHHWQWLGVMAIALIDLIIQGHLRVGLTKQRLAHWA